ncbi:hypothetical protein OH807_01690 [Kitasatospora sp. NBC_01560]|uniref:hypothetical protein n=1 Tax=Kitasatospora sp. NBC_01560 TaxID=2975965 RepID=UPI00386F1747
MEQLDELTATGYPALRHLDLGGSEFDATSLQLLAALADSPVLPQLETLAVPGLRIGRSDCADGEPLAELARLAPRFVHLALTVNGTVDIEGVDQQEADRLLGGASPRPQHGSGAREGN